MTDSEMTRSSIANALLYQLGWFACVVGAAQGWGTTGAGIALLLVVLHLGLVERPERELPLVLATATIGLGAETLHASFGILDFRGHQAGSVAPLWVVALWLQFGTVLHFCLRWLSRRYALASLLGLLGGPLAFWSGERLGAAAFGEPRAFSLALLGLSWALLLPALVAIADRVGGSGRYRLFKTAASTGLEQPAHEPLAARGSHDNPWRNIRWTKKR